MTRRGFTLIEVMVAMVVLAVGLLATVQMSLMYINSNSFNNMMTQATIIAQEKMEQMRAMARSERADNFSPLDFDYMVSNSTAFTSIPDPSGGGAPTSLVVHGFLSGNDGGSPVTAPWDSNLTYDVLFDDADHGGVAGSVYGMKDTVTVPGTLGGAAFEVERVWTVEPLNTDPVNNTIFDMARISVTSSWTDQFGKKRDVRLESVVNRRQ